MLWLKGVPWAVFSYNTSYRNSAQITPFRALYGRDPPPLLLHFSEGSPVDAANRLIWRGMRY